MFERGRTPQRASRARSASPGLGRHQATYDSPSTSIMPIAEHSHRAKSASPSASAFALKSTAYDMTKVSQEHMNRARPYFNTIHTVKFLDGFFGDDTKPRNVSDLDLSQLQVPIFGDNLKAGGIRRRFAKGLCDAINNSDLCPTLRFEPTGLLGSEMLIQAVRVKDDSPATEIALPIYIRDDQYFDPVWDRTLRNSTKYDTIRNDLLMDYVYHFQTAERTHLFSVEIAGPYARLVRSDHAGVIGSLAFNWKEEVFYLSEFLSRVGMLSNDGLGFDTTWSDATLEEANAALAAVKADDPEGDYSHVLVRKLLLLDDADTEDEGSAYDVFAILTRENSPKPELVGRYTTGYRAYCPQTKEVIWVKDSWTRRDPLIEPEGITMRKLHGVGVPHLARVHRAGYVRRADDTVQSTLSGRPKFKSETASEVVFAHYRIAFHDIGRPLTTYRSSRELAIVMRDAIEAHTLAFDAGTLHHDVSTGNVLITKDGRGMLIDWEMALDRMVLGKERYDKARQALCGTYAYLSTARMRARNAKQRWLHDVSDDLEAFFWVFFAMIFRTRYVLRFPSAEGGWSPEDHHMLLSSVFRDVGGEGKLALFNGIEQPVTAEKFLQYGMEDVLSARLAPEPLMRLLGSLWQGFRRQHGPYDVPSSTWRLDPDHAFPGEAIQDLFDQALQLDGWYDDDAALQCNIAKTFSLQLPIGMEARLAAISARDATVATAASAPQEVVSGKLGLDMESSQRMKRGRDDDEKENEEPRIASNDISVKRRRCT